MRLISVACGLGLPRPTKVPVRHHPPEPARAPKPRAPTSQVRVLRDGTELEDALRRAVRYEEAAEARFHGRAQRYHGLLGPETPGPPCSKPRAGRRAESGGTRR